jgi:hypothetical protein
VAAVPYRGKNDAGIQQDRRLRTETVPGVNDYK